MSPQLILVIIAIILAVASYYPGVPTLGVAVIILGAAMLVK
jgi:hypothetical protein